MRLILASASPRRKKLLARIDIEPDAIDPGNIDESPHARELPRDYAVRMAAEKAALVAPRHAGSLILAVDTVVAAGRRILPKTENEANARTCLSLLSGRRHRVLSAVTLIDEKGRPHQKLSTTIVMFKRLTKGKSPPISRAANGAAGRAAMRSRVLPNPGSASSLAAIRA